MVNGKPYMAYIRILWDMNLEFDLEDSMKNHETSLSSHQKMVIFRRWIDSPVLRPFRNIPTLIQGSFLNRLEFPFRNDWKFWWFSDDLHHDLSPVDLDLDQVLVFPWGNSPLGESIWNDILRMHWWNVNDVLMKC